MLIIISIQSFADIMATYTLHNRNNNWRCLNDEYKSFIIYGLSLIRRYDLSEQAATNAVKKSYLYELLQNEPEETMHDSVNDSADDVYYEIFEKRS